MQKYSRKFEEKSNKKNFMQTRTLLTPTEFYAAKENNDEDDDDDLVNHRKRIESVDVRLM